MRFYFEVLREDDTYSKTYIYGNEVEIRLPQGDTILLAPRPDGYWVKVDSDSTSVEANGIPFRHGMVPWDSILTLGKCQILLGCELGTFRSELEASRSEPEPEEEDPIKLLSSLKEEREAFRCMQAASDAHIRWLSEENEAIKKQLLVQDKSYASLWYRESLRLVSRLADLADHE